jgi:hypothetical protein
MQLNYFSPTSPYYDAMNTLEMLSKEVRYSQLTHDNMHDSSLKFAFQSILCSSTP